LLANREQPRHLFGQKRRAEPGTGGQEKGSASKDGSSFVTPVLWTSEENSGRAIRPAFSAIADLDCSERQLQRHLSDPAIAGTSNLAESAASDIARWVGELSMIEDIKKLCAEL